MSDVAHLNEMLPKLDFTGVADSPNSPALSMYSDMCEARNSNFSVGSAALTAARALLSLFCPRLHQRFGRRDT